VAGFRSLFASYAAPLVLKCDNAKAFTARATRALLRAWGVHALLSPPYTPSYNGGAEAGIGGSRVRTHRRAAALGHPEVWSCDDLEFARAEGNVLARPWVPGHASADTLWDGRLPITSTERASLRSALLRELHALPGTPDRPRSRTARLRRALARALVSEGLLVYRKRRLALPLLSSKVANIT